MIWGACADISFDKWFTGASRIRKNFAPTNELSAEMASYINRYYRALGG